ncbi:MAG: cyclic nucleotide-binding domain-containing protein, partial [Nitrospinota bacterium]
MPTPAAITIALLDKVRHSIPFLKDFGLEELKAILRNCQQVSYPSGSYIIREGEVSDKMFIVIKGEVEVSRSQPGGEETLCVLGTGECFGEMGIIEKTRRSA